MDILTRIGAMRAGKGVRRLCLCVVFALCLVPAFAQRKELAFHLAFEPYFACVFGQLDEYVFQKYNGEWERLSLLEWEEKPRWEYGMRVGSSYKKVHLDLHIASSFTAPSGEMRDSDWQNMSDWSMKTNYSVSDNKISSYLNFGGSVGFAFSPWEKMTLMPLFEVGYSNLLFKAYGGEAWYGTNTTPFCSWDSPNAVHSTFEGNIIDYDRWSIYTYLGMVCSFMPIDRLALDFFLGASPYTYAESMDIHHLRSLRFKDITNSVFKHFKGNATVRYSFNDVFTLGLSLDGYLVTQDRGDTWYSTKKSNSFKKIEDEQGGIAAREAAVSLFLRMYVF